MNNRLYRYTGRVLQREVVETTSTYWVEDVPDVIVPPITPPIVPVTPPYESPFFVQWVGLAFSPCLTSEGRQGQMLIQTMSNGETFRASDCLINDGLWP
jgi:hypothetical protein